MKLRRRITTATIAGATALAMGGCSADGDSDADTDGADEAPHELTIGWIPANTTGVFNTATSYFEAAVDEANENDFDIELIVQAPAGGEADSAGFQQIIENFISSAVDVIVVSPGDSQSIKPAVRGANEADIPVVYVNLLDDPDDVDVSAFVGFDNVDAGRISAYSVLDYFGGPGVFANGEQVEVTEDDYLDLAFWEDLYADADLSDIEVSGALIEGVRGTVYSNQRLEGFNEVMELAPGVDILTTLAGDWDRQVGADAASAIVSGYDELDFVWAASNEMALGTASILDGADRLDVNADGGEPTPGLTALFTNDSTSESTEAIRAGEIIAETSHGFADWGWVGTQVAVELGCGLEVERFNDIRPRTVYFGNADSFHPDPTLPEIDWADIADRCDAS